MAFSFFTVLVAFLVASASYIYLLVQHNTPKDGFQPLTVPGPVLLGAATGINLDGLTLIRTVKLPTVVVHLPGVGTIKIKNSTSELVFPKLRAKDVRVHSHDLASSPTTLIATVDAALSGSCAVFLDFTLRLPFFGPRTFRRQTSGRLKLELENLTASLPISVGTARGTGEPIVHQHSLDITSGRIASIDFSASPHAGIATKLPLWLSMKPIANFLLSDLLRSREVKEATAAVWANVRPAFDLEPWNAISSTDRQKRPPVLQRSIPRLQAHFSVLGQTNLTSIVLPDHIPDLYPEGGKRAYWQSWNKLTSGLKVEITNNSIHRFGFNRAVLEWNHLPTVPPEAIDAITQDANVMVCRLENFLVEMHSSFAMYANTSKALKLVTGMESLGEKGDSRAIVKASRLELVFRVTVDENGVAIATKSVDDFDSVEVSITGLRSKKDEWVNNVLKIVRPHIASVASMMVKKYLTSEVQKGGKLFETIEETLLLRGVEVPGLFRARKRTEVEDAAQDAQLGV